MFLNKLVVFRETFFVFFVSRDQKFSSENLETAEWLMMTISRLSKASSFVKDIL